MAFYFHKFLGMLRKVKEKVLTLILVVVPLFLLGSGCQSLPSPAAQIDSNRGDWEADVGRIKTTATFYAKQVRTKVSESDPTRSALEQKYREAMVAVNLWIQDVQDSIRAGRPPTESRLYKLREIAANEKYSRFVIAAEEAVRLDVRPKWLPLAALAPGAVDFLWKRALEAAQKRTDEARRVRAEYAARLDQYRLPDFAKTE
jgi:hypothetical protein